jgi:plastocyanin
VKTVLLALPIALVLVGCSKDETTKPVVQPGSNTPFDSGIQSAGFEFVQAFSAAGNVPYYCTPHSGLGMTGTVIVSDTSSTEMADVVVGPSGSLTYNPPSVTVKVGGSVRWTWGSSGHTVTSGIPTAAGAGPAMAGMDMTMHPGH